MRSEKELFCDLAQRIADSFPEIENDIVTYLFRTDEKYAALRKEADEIQRAHPFIMEVLEGSKEISLSTGEHGVLAQFLNLSSQIEDIERQQIYFRGHTDSFAYLKRIGAI